MEKVEQVYKEMRPLVERWLDEQKAKALQEGHRIGLEEGLERGRRLGVSEGLRTALERVLVARFGPVGEDVSERLKRASEQQLGIWLERAARASSIEEVFGSRPDDGQSQ